MEPKDLIFTKEHEWARVEGNRATVGLTSYAQEHLGDIVFVDLPALGTAVAQGEQLLVVESVKAASDVYAPLSGTVLATNELLAGAPEKVNQDPYGEGWVAQLELSRPVEVSSLLTPADYEAFLASLV